MAGSWDNFVKAQGIIKFGEAKTPLCIKTAAANDTAAAFTVDDFIGEAKGLTGIGASKETTEVSALRYDSAAQLTGKVTPNDVTMPVNINKHDLDLFRGYFNSDQLLSVGIFDSASGNPLLYGFNGTVSGWSFDASDGEIGELSIQFAIVNDNVAHTYTA